MDLIAYENLTGKTLEDKRENWRGLCVSHQENTPSFFIQKDSYLSHCFGCGLGGYLDNILAKQFNLSIEQVRRQLDIPLRKVSNKHSLDEVVESFNKTYLSSFQRISMHPFLKKRGFKSDTVLLHRARWDPNGRIVFPLTSIGDPTIVGAAGRTVKDHDKKWYFYWNTRKGSIVYQALDTLQINIIVEGIFDVMWLNQHGYSGAAALLGSKATKKQVNIIKDSTNEVTLFLDNDEAGRIGQHQLAEALRDSVKVYFAKYQEGRNDPQEFTEEELKDAIENKETYIEYFSCR